MQAHFQFQDVGPGIVYNDPNRGQVMQPRLALQDIVREEVAPAGAITGAIAVRDVNSPGPTTATPLSVLATPKKALVSASEVPLGYLLTKYRTKVAEVPVRKWMKVMKAKKKGMPDLKKAAKIDKPPPPPRGERKT